MVAVVDLSDTALAIAAAEAGAAVIRDRFGTSVARFDKDGTDFATETDFESERAILAALRAHRPGDQVVGEETGTSGPESNRQWLVDPLCGTLNFAARTPMACVNVALRVDGFTTAAASADPLAGELFWTDGAAAFRRGTGADTVLAPSTRSRIVDVDLDPPFPNVAWFRAVDLLADPEFSARYSPRVLSTTLGVAWVAAGRRAGYLADGDVRESVHFAAGIALCRAAGCVVTGLRGEPLESGAVGLLAAADQATHATLLKMIAASAR
jgi:myo-inositol-1(or 4)-monophosphatase